MSGERGGIDTICLPAPWTPSVVSGPSRLPQATECDRRPPSPPPPPEAVHSGGHERVQCAQRMGAPRGLLRGMGNTALRSVGMAVLLCAAEGVGGAATRQCTMRVGGAKRQTCRL